MIAVSNGSMRSFGALNVAEAESELTAQFFSVSMPEGLNQSPARIIQDVDAEIARPTLLGSVAAEYLDREADDI